MDPHLTFTGGLMLVAVLLGGGFVMGFLAGLFGIGGGAILVPILYEAFKAVGVDQSVLMHLCLGTGLAVMVPTSVSSFRSHRAKGTVDMPYLKRIAPWIVGGVLLGSVIARYADGRTLMGIWALVGFIIAGKMAFGRDEWRLGDDVPSPPVPEIFSLVTGTLSTLMSVGGSSFMVAFLTLYNRPILKAVSTSAGLGPLVSIPGALGFVWAGLGNGLLPPLSLGYVSLIGAAIVTPVSVWAAPIGVRVAHAAPKRALEIGFAIFLATMSLRFLLGWLF